jgi:transcription-repair coupling factor (superfamily II helicase)
MQELRETEFKDLYSDRSTDDFIQYVKDCVIETDLEIRIPDDYVNNVAERLSLYQKLDSLANTTELESYATKLIDRFGPLPKTVKELFRSFELRWLAQDIGIEKLVIKSGTMVCYFISNPQSSYFDSTEFKQVLRYVQGSPKECKLSEKNDKLRLIYTNIFSIDQAKKRLGEVLESVGV